jgi:hypothetical protein
MVFFYGSIVAKKKKMAASITFFDGFIATKWRHVPFCGFGAKKVTAVMSSPSSMVVVLWRR